MKLYMFRTVPLSIIRGSSLYTQRWYMSFSFGDCLRAGSGWSWSCSQVVCKTVWYIPLQLASRIRIRMILSLILLASCLQNLWHIALLCVQWRTP